MTTIHAYEVELPVRDYLPRRKIEDMVNSPEAQKAFAAAKADVKRAKKMWVDEMNAANKKIESLSLLEFVEFDSTQADEAFAIFSIRYEGDAPAPLEE